MREDKECLEDNDVLTLKRKKAWYGETDKHTADGFTDAGRVKFFYIRWEIVKDAERRY